MLRQSLRLRALVSSSQVFLDTGIPAFQHTSVLLFWPLPVPLLFPQRVLFLFSFFFFFSFSCALSPCRSVSLFLSLPPLFSISCHGHVPRLFDAPDVFSGPGVPSGG